MKLFNLIIVFLAMAQTVQAAGLADLQRMALSSREVIRRYQANLEKSDQEVGIAKSGYYPSVDLSYTVNSLDTKTFAENRESSIAQGAVTWNLFAGFRDRYNLRSATLLRRAHACELQGIGQDIQLKVALRLLAVFTRKASLKVARDARQTLAQICRDAEHRFEVGLIDKNQLLKFRVDLDNARIVEKKAEAGLTKSVQLLGREVGAGIRLEDLDFAEFGRLPALEEGKDYPAEMLARRSEIKVLQETARAAELRARVAAARYLPRLDLVGSYRKYADGYLGGSGNEYYGEELRGQLVMSLNLFDGFAKNSRVASARLEARAVRYELDELKADLSTTLRNLLLDYQVSVGNAGVARRGIRQAEENLRISRLKYGEGLEKESDLLDAVANLSRARSNHVNAVSEVFANYFKIIRAVEGFQARVRPTTSSSS